MAVGTCRLHWDRGLSALTPRGPAWNAARRACFERDEFECRECGRPGRLECHHVVSMANGGAALELANLRTMCRGCHIRVHTPTVNPAQAAWNALVTGIVGKDDP